MIKNIFSQVLAKKPKSNVFDLTHDVKMSGKMGNLMPCCVMEAVPGDKFKLASDIFLRFAPLQAPIMHRVNAYVHYYFVPNRILWDNWEKFITNEVPAQFPTITINGGETASEKKLLDYLGIPPASGGATPTPISALPLSAYQCIYNEYYRDENLVNEVNFKVVDGDNTTNTDLLELRNRAWEHDYFTASLPFAQKGQAVDIPLGDVTLKDNWTTQGTPTFVDGSGSGNHGGNILNTNATNPPSITIDDPIGGQVNPSAYDPNGTLEVGSTTINELRRAMRLQEWLEKNARGGTRYIENILQHFGVRSKDARLQRPEYITGTKAPVVISEVLNQTGETGGLPQGNMAGHAVSVGQGYKGDYYVTEHGYIVAIMSVMPKTNYQQGIPATYSKTQPTDFYWPSFAHIGEQEVKNKEIFAYTPDNDNTFGYIPRYSEYKYIPSRVAGDFRTVLNYWHLGRIFTGLPALNEQFIECTPEQVDRIFAVQSGEDNLYIECLNKVKAIRPMPVYGTPML